VDLIQNMKCGCVLRLTPEGLERVESCLRHEDEGEDEDG